MTDDEAKALGLRAVACSGWRWMPGMLARADGHPAIRLCEEVVLFVWRAWPALESGAAICLQGDAWPDFRDPATLGCLLALVREAWGMWLSVRESPALVGPPIYAAHSHRHYATEAEALVAAMEAAPARVSP